MNEIEKPLKSANMHDVVQDWYAKFVEVQQETLFELILAANYMDIKPLLDLTCATVASMIKVCLFFLYCVYLNVLFFCRSFGAAHAVLIFLALFWCPRWRVMIRFCTVYRVEGCPIFNWRGRERVILFLFLSERESADRTCEIRIIIIFGTDNYIIIFAFGAFVVAILNDVAAVLTWETEKLLTHVRTSDGYFWKP